VASSGCRWRRRDMPDGPFPDRVPLPLHGSSDQRSGRQGRLGLRKGHLACSLQPFVERGVLRVRPGPFDGVAHHLARIDRSVAAPGGRRQPIIMLSRHQYEFPPALIGNLDRLSPGLMLKLAELALEFQGAGLN
jgi:hypothetical protein